MRGVDMRAIVGNGICRMRYANPDFCILDTAPKDPYTEALLGFGIPPFPARPRRQEGIHDPREIARVAPGTLRSTRPRERPGIRRNPAKHAGARTHCPGRHSRPRARFPKRPGNQHRRLSVKASLACRHARAVRPQPVVGAGRSGAVSPCRRRIPWSRTGAMAAARSRTST